MQSWQGSFAIIQRDAAKSEKGFFDELYLFNYACQEDMPFNTYEGYQKFTASQKYPYIGDAYDPLAKMVFGVCMSFKPQQRDNWQVPVVSDIPTCRSAASMTPRRRQAGPGWRWRS